jgi:uncharacterized protein (DUF58 family)
MTEPIRDVVDPGLLARLKGLTVQAGRTAGGVLSGLHKSTYQGSSVEFAQHREYAPGDDLRHIDWKAYGKSDRYYIKQFDDETNLRVYLVVDTSGSMAYGGSGRPDKLTYAAQLSACLAWLMLHQGDAVGLLTYGEKLRELIPPSPQPSHFWRIVSALNTVPANGETDLVGALSYVAEMVSRRSLVIILSDCFHFDDRVAAIARQLHRRRHQVLMLNVLDPDESQFPFTDLTVFEDMESEVEVVADPQGMRRAYLEEFSAWQTELRSSLLEGDVKYHRVETDQALEPMLYAILSEARR